MNKYAFLVGVGEYAAPTIAPVHFATRDAEIIGAVLRERCGFKTTVLANPSAGEFARSLGDLLTVVEREEDLFVFFFAGHGVVYENESYLLLKDAYPEDRLGMYQLSALRDKFGHLRSKNRLVFLDCCRNDPRPGRGAAANMMSGRLSADLNGLGARDIGPAAAGSGAERLTLLLKACGEGERAYEWAARKHGTFSWFLKEGLEGAAWRDGLLSAHSLCDYVSDKVSAWAEEQQVSQRPDFRQDGAAGDIVLAGEARRVVPPEDAAPAAAYVSEPVACSLCGKYNAKTDTFRCVQCGRDNLCVRHQNPKSYLCETCESAAAEQRRREAEAAARVTERRAEEEARAQREEGEARKRAEEPSPTYTNSLGMEFVLIPAGTFWMGSEFDDEAARDNERPRHLVTISRPFLLGMHPVTQAQWQAVMDDNPSRCVGEDLPVESVSWHDAQRFLQALNAREGHSRYRLPTEAEWEYACRAGSEEAYSFGGNKKRLENHAWYYGNAGKRTHPVGQKQPNAWGLHDMHGNVLEWVQDWYGAYRADVAADPQGPAISLHRVLRGGGWRSNARDCRSGNRERYVPSSCADDFGFRVALSVEDVRPIFRNDALFAAKKGKKP